MFGEYVCFGGRDVREGSFLLGMYDGCKKGLEKGMLFKFWVCICEIDGRFSFMV